MPLYLYQCPRGHRTERFRPLCERNDTVPCPECEGEAERVLTAPRLKADGAYSFRFDK